MSDPVSLEPTDDLNKVFLLDTFLAMIWPVILGVLIFLIIVVIVLYKVFHKKKKPYTRQKGPENQHAPMGTEARDKVVKT